MTQPSLNTTFDTSLIDLSQRLPQEADPSILNGSFSTTESASSENDGAAAAAATEASSRPSSSATTQIQPPTPPARQTRTAPTNAALYDAWSATYDTDGNILQAVDDLELATLFPTFLSLLPTRPSTTLRLVDLGCGTGRNTQKLMTYPWPPDTPVRVTGVDASPKMLEIAERKMRDNAMEPQRSAHRRRDVTFRLMAHDFLASADEGDAGVGEADAVISTLVLEHFPLATFFRVLRSLLKRGGVALVTNMHPEMGARSQAGFLGTDGAGQAVKVRGMSWVHGVLDTTEAAAREGFEIVGEVRERGVSEEMVGLLGVRARKWVGCLVWYGVVVKRMD